MLAQAVHVSVVGQDHPVLPGELLPDGDGPSALRLDHLDRSL